MCHFICRIFILFAATCSAQNLVLNGDFEEGPGQNAGVIHWNKCVSGDTPDFFDDSLSKNLYKKYRGGTSSYSGRSHAGLFVYRNSNGKTNEVREFLQGALAHPLARDTFYTVTAFLKTDEESNAVCDGFTFHFSRAALHNKDAQEMYDLPPHVSATPKKVFGKDKWQMVSGNYRATGGEQYVVIGNLKPDANTCVRSSEVPASSRKNKWRLQKNEEVVYLYIDNISVVKNDSLNRLSRETAAAKQLKKLRALAVKDSLKRRRDSLQKTAREAHRETEKQADELVKMDPSTLNKGRTITLPMLQFEVNKAVLKKEAAEQLYELISYMEQHPALRIEIKGHTDNDGDAHYNLNLSKARARAVAGFLEENGIESARMETSGYGSSLPVSSNETEEGRAKNRRIEIFITLE